MGLQPGDPTGQDQAPCPTCHPRWGPLGRAGGESLRMKLLLFGSWEEIWVPGWGRGMQVGDPALLKESAWACPSCTGEGGIGLQAQEKAAVPQACRGVHRGRVCTQRELSPTAERDWGLCLTHLLKSKGIVPPSRWERCRPGGPQRRVGPSPLPTPPWLPRPRQPARHSPLASRRREVTLRAAHWAPPPPPAAPSAARLKGPKDRRDGAGWEWDGA